MSKNIAIIGSGISGLSTAFFLKKFGHDKITVIESNKISGGVIETKLSSKYKFETGPNTLSVSDYRVMEMFNELNLKIKYPNPLAKNRFVLKNKIITKVPDSFLSFLKTKLFSFETKIKILFEFFNRLKPVKKEESVYDFFNRRFNKEFVEYAINPFIAGTYSGNPKNLGIKYVFPLLVDLEKKYGSIFKGFLKKNKNKYKIKRTILSFDNGLYDLISSLSIKLQENIILSSKVTRIGFEKNKFNIEYIKNQKITKMQFDKVVLTVPLHRINDIQFDMLLKNKIKSLSEVYYPPIKMVTIAFKNNDYKEKFNGYGILVPEVEKMNILGVLYLSSMFNDSAPKDETLITVFVGGARQPSLAKLDDKKIEKIILDDLKVIYGFNVKPEFIKTRFWPHSIPQYDLNYSKKIDLIKSIETDCPGLLFNGNFINGISLENNILNSLEIAKNI